MSFFVKSRCKLLSVFTALILSVTLILPMSGIGAAAADDYPHYDNWGFYTDQCTSFAAWCLNSRNDIGFTCYYKGVFWGNAGDWGPAARSAGLTVDMNPTAGSIYWLSPNAYGASSYGHVGWVRSVSGGYVTIEEYNWGSAVQSYNVRTIAASNASGYIHFGNYTGSSGQSSSKVRVTGLSLGTYNRTMKQGDSFVLSTIIFPSNATDKSVSFSSSNTSIAKVNQSGVVTATGAGTAYIYASTNDGGYTCYCTVTVEKKNATLTIYAGQNVDGSWQTLKSVSAKLVSYDGTITRTVIVNSQGIVSDLPPGAYTMTVRKQGYAERKYTVYMGTSNTGVKAELCELGDINGDGEITSKDSMLAVTYAKRSKTPIGYKFSIADMNIDGKVNTTDSLAVIAIAKKQ